MISRVDRPRGDGQQVRGQRRGRLRVEVGGRLVQDQHVRVGQQRPGQGEPLVLFLLAPALTEHRLKAFNGWLRAHGSTLLVGAIVVAGALMVFDGSYGLITGK